MYVKSNKNRGNNTCIGTIEEKCYFGLEGIMAFNNTSSVILLFAL